jgi:autotransporter-associated beta strand protein
VANGDNRLPTTTTVTLGVGYSGGTLQLGDGVNASNQTLAGIKGRGNVWGGGSDNARLTLALVDGVADYFSGQLGGSGANQNNLSLTIQGVGPAFSGTECLQGTWNTYTGGTTLESAGLLALNGDLLGSGLVTLAGGTLEPMGTFSNEVLVESETASHVAIPRDLLFPINSLTLNGNISGSGTLYCTNGAGGQAVVNLGGDNSGFTGTFEECNSGTTTMTTYFTSPNAGSANATWQIDSGTLAADVSGAQTIHLGALSGSGGVLTNAMAGSTVTFEVGGKNQSSEFDGVIQNGSGAVALTKLGAGTLTLTGASTYSGATTIQNGTLALAGGDDRLPVGTTVVNGGVLQLSDGTTAYNQTLAGLTGNGHVIGGGTNLATLTLDISSRDSYRGVLGGSGTNANNLALVKTGSGELDLSGVIYSGGTTISAGKLIGGSFGSGSITLAGGTLLANSTIGNAIVAQANTTSYLGAYLFSHTLTGSISGSGTIVNDLGATLNLGGDNSGFSGTFKTMYDYTTCFTSAAAGSSNAIWQIDGGTLTADVPAAATIALGSLAGDADSILRNDSADAEVTYEIGGMNESRDFDGIIEDGSSSPVAVTKTGTATLTLAGANAYSGETTIQSGVLAVAGSIGNVVVDGGALLPGLSAAGAVSTSNLSFTTGSSYGVDVTDAGGGPIRATGTVALDDATLDVTSSRTNNNYGILRVLVQNDGTDAVAGTFAGLPEGDTVTVNGVTYWITYQYNAEAGQFGTGNDVALVSSLFSVAAGAESQVVTATTSEHIQDATREQDQLASQFQLHTSLSSHDPNWPVGDPQIAITDEDPTVATLDSNGVVTFSQTGVCRILAVSPATEFTPEQTFELLLMGSTAESPIRYIPDTFVASNNLLVLYNADSQDSTDLMNYYKANRPGVANATYLGISAATLSSLGYDLGGVTSLPDTAGTSYASVPICNAIVDYVTSWIEQTEQNSPTTHFRYIVGLCGLPSREGYTVYGGGPSVSYMIYSQLLAGTGKSDYGGGADRFSIAEYGAPLVAWLDCGSYAATDAYINKEILAANAGGLEADGITISGNAAGIGGTTYYLDDTNTLYNTDYFDDTLSDLVNDGVSPDDIVHHPAADNSLIATITDPTAYGSWGTHTAEGNPHWDNWPLNGEVTIVLNKTCQIGTESYHAGWWISMSVESYNGMYGYYMGDPVDFFAANAFGGTAVTATINGVDYPYYTNTPICLVGSTTEPGLPGNEGVAYFDQWARGFSTLEAAWAGRATPYFVAVTDICLEP